MSEAKRGLSSWLHKPKPQELPTFAPETAMTSVATAEDKEAATSPLDITLAILRAKETINRISPDKRALVEEIDVEEDDGEFDEKAHWGRRSAASRRKKLKATRNAKAQQPNYSIKTFCIPQGKDTEVVAEHPEADTQREGIAGEVAAHGETDQSSVDAENSLFSSSGRSSSDSCDRAESASAAEDVRAAMTSTESMSTDLVDSEKGVVGATKGKTDEPPPPAAVQVVEVIRSRDGDASSATPTPTGRPKRQAVLKAQALEQTRKQTPPPFTTEDADNIVDLVTPPGRNKGKKVLKSKRDAATNGFPDLKTPPVGRKRKLEMDKSTPSPGVKMVPKESFFLSEQDKKQLQEIEAVATLREQLRKTREKDLAFFSGKTAMNPFFQAPPQKSQAKNHCSGGANTSDAIEIDGSGSAAVTPGSVERKGTSKSRWSKDAILFPAVQHIVCGDIDTEEQPLLKLPRKPISVVPEEAIVCLLDDDDEMGNAKQSSLFAASSAYMQQQVHTEASFSDLFWFRQYHDRMVDTTYEQDEQLSVPGEYDSENALIEALVDKYGAKEKRVRELLDGLIAAKEKRCEKEHNLTLVDRYLPVTASGIVGNKDPMRLLSSWLSAWKLGGGEQARRSCFQAELFVFEDDESDEDELSDLCRLFILEGESGAGKSAAVYACAEELGYHIIEINAGQNRAGRSIVEIAGEATQSTRVLHMGNPAEKKNKKISKKKKRKSTDSTGKPTASHLSLVLFEDADLVFDEDKGFLASLCSIAKHSKCPIVLTCRELPDSFPATPQRLSQVVSKPSVEEFSTWMMLVAYLEQLPLTPALTNTMATFFKCDIRHSLHFLQTYLPHFVEKQTLAKWTWQPDCSGKSQQDACESVVVDLHDDGAQDAPVEHPSIVVPAWSLWPSRSFDMMSSNLLSELSACPQRPEEDKTMDERVADAHLIQDLSAVLDAVSVAALWSRSDTTDHEDNFFEHERDELKSLDLRMTSLSAFLAPGGIGDSIFQQKPPTCSSDCVKRTLEAALVDEQRNGHQAALSALKSKVELPLTAVGPGISSTRFDLDYMPMISRILSSNASHQESRRRVSRRNHYLREVIADMSLLDEIPKFTTYLQQAESDQIVAASPSSSPLS